MNLIEGTYICTMVQQKKLISSYDILLKSAKNLICFAVQQNGYVFKYLDDIFTSSLNFKKDKDVIRFAVQ
jgi:hypothetical protein